jgi:hypothetical protein
MPSLLTQDSLQDEGPPCFDPDGLRQLADTPFAQDGLAGNLDIVEGPLPDLVAPAQTCGCRRTSMISLQR